MSLQKKYLGLLALLSLLLPAALVADGLTPFSIDGKTGSYATLQAAVDDAEAGDTILIAPCSLENNEYGPEYATTVSGRKDTYGAQVFVNKSLSFKNSGAVDSAILKDFTFVMLGNSTNPPNYTFGNMSFSGQSILFFDNIGQNIASGPFGCILIQNCVADCEATTANRTINGAAEGGWNCGSFIVFPAQGKANCTIASFVLKNNHISTTYSDSGHANRCVYGSMRSANILVEDNTFGRADKEGESGNKHLTYGYEFVFERMLFGSDITFIFRRNTCHKNTANSNVYFHSDEGDSVKVNASINDNRIYTQNGATKGNIATVQDVDNWFHASVKLWNNYVNDFCCNDASNGSASTDVSFDAQIGHTAGDLVDVDTMDDGRKVVYLANGTLKDSTYDKTCPPQWADSFTGTDHGIQEMPAGKACPHCARYEATVTWKSYAGADDYRKDKVQYKIVDDAGEYPEAPATADLPKPADDSVFLKWDADLTKPVLVNTTVTGQWDGYFHVIHNSDDTDEKILISDLLKDLPEDAKSFDITEPTKAAYSGIKDGFIYGGLWTDADEDGLRSDVCGKELPIPAVGETIYLREVADCYAKPYGVSYRLGGVYHTILFAPIDLDGTDDNVKYAGTGFLFQKGTDDEEEEVIEEVYDNIKITTPSKVNTFNAVTDPCNTTAGFLLCSKFNDVDVEAWTKAGKEITVNPYFITPDNVKVFAATQKVIKFAYPNAPMLTTNAEDGWWTEKYEEQVGVERLPMLRMTTFANGDMESAQVVLTLHADGLVSQVSGNAGGDFRALAGSPALEGSLFAGWFADAEFACPMDLSCLDEDADAYARFVKADGLLEVKAEATSACGRLLRVRLLAACLEDAASCGFLWENGGNSAETVADGHYLRVDGRDAASLFNAEDAALFFCDIPFTSLDAEAELSVTPFWTTADGAKVLGRKSAIDLKKFF